MIQKVKEKKRICWITPDYFLLVDSSVVPHLANDYDIKWIIINTKNSKRRIENIEAGKLLPQEINLKYKQRDPRIIFQYIEILREVKDGNYDLVYLSFHGLPFFLPVFFTMIGTKGVIYGTHNVSTPKGASHAYLMRLYNWYNYRRFQNFHVFSPSQYHLIKKLFPGKKHFYVPIALKDYGTSDIHPPDEVIRFLFFGYIRDYKRLDLLLKSYKDLLDDGVKNIELIIAGNCENWKYYENMIPENGKVTTRIEIIPDNDIPDVVSSCHYMVLPYSGGAQSAVLTVAYQYGKPVIVSDIESFNQFVTEGSTGFSFINGSQESLTAVMKKVISGHDKHYEALKENIREYVSNEFAINKIIDAYKNLIEECLIR